MQVAAKAERVINSSGNQQLNVTGVVTPFGHSGVLPEGEGISYVAKIEHVESSGGMVSFALSIEALPAVEVTATVEPEPTQPTEPAKELEPPVDNSKPTAPKNLRVTSN
jgi:hypothetical protein